MARVTGLEPATSGVTGRHSNRLSYTRALKAVGLADRFVGRCLRGSVLSVKRPGAYSGESAAGISYDGAIAAHQRNS